MNNFSIGLLEMGYREDNKNSLETIQEVIDYAIRADELGFSRFWLTEHHDDDTTLSYASPEILISLIVGMTDRIKVGAAGILTKIHDPYLTASNFKFLNNLFYNRIDLGLANSNPDNLYLVNKVYNPKDENLFENKLKQIYSLLYDEKLTRKKEQLVLPPFGGLLPDLWCLSVSYRSFDRAIKYKMNYCRSIMHGKGLINDNYGREELIKFKDQFYNSNNFLPKVNLNIGISINKNSFKNQSKFQATKNSNLIHFDSIGQLEDLLYEYQILYGIDEFILWDTEVNNDKKLENIEAISNIFNLNKELVSEVKENI